MDVELKINLGPWLPEAAEHENPGLVAVRGWHPSPTAGWRPYPYFVKTATNLGGLVYGGHYHTWGSVWEAYVARANSANVAITQIDLQAGSPPSTFALGTATDVTGTPWASTPLVDHGYCFASFGKYVLLAGDETKQMQARDSTGSSAFADAIPSGSVDRPSGRYMAVAGFRVVIAYVKHNSATSQANYSSDSLTDENLVIFSGLKSGYSYWSTENTAAGGSNDWDPEELANHYRLTDSHGVITGLVTTTHGFGLLFKERGVYRFDFQVVPADFRLISAEHGTRFPQSIVALDDEVYWMDQLGHYCRYSGGAVEDLSSSSAMTALLDDDAVFMGRYPEQDLTQGKTSAEATAFAYGATAPWRCAIDDSIMTGTGVKRYPVGYRDAQSGTVRWIYPSTYMQMEGVASVASGTTTLSWSSGTLFDHADNSFMDGRAIDLDGGTHTTTVSSVTNRQSLELAVAAPSTLTDVAWTIPFQRYIELVYQPLRQVWAATDVTHAWNKTAGQRPWAMHWGISAPGFGLRLTRTPDVPQRQAHGPRDVLYPFIYLTSSGTDFYSLTYAWPYGTVAGVDQSGYALLDDPMFVTSFFGIPSQAESGAASRVVAIRPVYTARQRALEDLGIDVEMRVVVLTKHHSGSQRDSAGNVTGPLSSGEMTYDLGQAIPAGNARAWISTPAAKAGQWHQLVVWFPCGSWAANDPVTAFETISAIDYIEVKLQAVAM